MTSVRITSVGRAEPPYRIQQGDAALRIGDAAGDARRVAAIARGTQIDYRTLALSPAEISRLGSIEERNQRYAELAPSLAFEAARRTLAGRQAALASIGRVVTTSCTGYMVPGWDVDLVQELGLSPASERIPLTQAGCAGGVVAIARAADYARAHPGKAALAVAAELFSLAFHPRTEAGNLTASLIFGDGAGAALIESTDAAAGLEIIDSSSTLLPCSRDAIGFALTDGGFYPLLTRELAEILPAPTLAAAAELASRHGLELGGVAFWLVHPGGARILTALEATLDLPEDALRWSRASLRDHGNMSSVSILDILGRYLDDATAPRGWGLVVAFGPGVSLELLLVRRC